MSYDQTGYISFPSTLVSGIINWSGTYAISCWYNSICYVHADNQVNKCVGELRIRYRMPDTR